MSEEQQQVMDRKLPVSLLNTWTLEVEQLFSPSSRPRVLTPAATAESHARPKRTDDAVPPPARKDD